MSRTYTSSLIVQKLNPAAEVDSGSGDAPLDNEDMADDGTDSTWFNINSSDLSSSYLDLVIVSTAFDSFTSSYPTTTHSLSTKLNMHCTSSSKLNSF